MLYVDGNPAKNTTWRFISVYKICDILNWVEIVKIVHILLLTGIFFMFNSCQTIEQKSQKAIKEENEKLSKFIQQPESELKIVMGEPDYIIYSDQGSKFFVYNKKKYNITCERKFEINQNKMVVGFTSKGCF